MRKLNIFIISILFIAICLGIVTYALSNNLSFQIENVSDAYVFPNYKEGKYKDMTYIEKINDCQIPYDTLNKMSTNGLIETCLKYPFYFDMVFRETPYIGFKKTIQNFNGLNELLSREDASEELFKFYNSIDFSNISESNDEGLALRMRYLEYIISQNEIIYKMTKDMREDLVKICIENLMLKIEKYPDVFTVDPTLLIIGRILSIDNDEFVKYIEENPKIQQFVEEGTLQEMSQAEWENLFRILEIL